MRAGIHPDYHEVQARCACGASWTTYSTKSELHLEICSSCHPFFTGRQKLVDPEGRVEQEPEKPSIKKQMKDAYRERLASKNPES